MNYNINLFNKNIFVIIILLLITQCKIPSTVNNASKTKSLNNFSSKNTFILNNCTPDQPEILMESPDIRAQKAISIQNKWLIHNVAIPENKNNFKSVIKEILSAVPYINLIYFFDIANGMIYIQNDLSICQKKGNSSLFKENKNSDMFACWFLNKTNSSNKIGINAEVYILAEEAPIRHSLIRSLAFVQSLFINPQIINKILQNNPLAEYMPYMNIHFLDTLEQAYWEDIKINQPENLEHMLNKKTKLEKESVAFKEAIFAEAFDSYYCSSKTHEIFRTKFPRTYNAFNAHIMQ